MNWNEMSLGELTQILMKGIDERFETVATALSRIAKELERLDKKIDISPKCPHCGNG